MIATQFQGLTGRRRKPNYTNIINAQSRHLPALYARKEQQQYRDRLYGLEKERIEEAKGQSKKARRLGYANIGLGAALGVGQLMSGGDGIADFGFDAASEAVPYDVGVADYYEVPSGDMAGGFLDTIGDWGSNIYEATIDNLLEGIF